MGICQKVSYILLGEGEGFHKYYIFAGKIFNRFARILQRMLVGGDSEEFTSPLRDNDYKKAYSRSL